MQLSDIQSLSNRASISRNARSLYQLDLMQERSEKTYSRADVIRIFKNTNIKVYNNKFDKIIEELSEEGHVFKTKSNNNKVFTIEDVYLIADKIGVKPYHELKMPAFVSILINLKGGVGKSLGTNNLVDALVHLDEFILKRFRVLIIDLDPQGSSTQHRLGVFDGEDNPTALMTMADGSGELLQNGIIKTSHPFIDILPADIQDGFLQHELENSEISGTTPFYELLSKNVIEKVQYDYDFILIDVGPHMDTVLLNAFGAANGLFIPSPTNILDWDSTLKFIERLPTAFEKIIAQGYSLDKLKFINGYISKDSPLKRKGSQEDNLYRNAENELYEIFGVTNVIKSSLPSEDAYSRLGNDNASVFTITKNSEYEGDSKALKRARDTAEEWAKEMIRTILTYHPEVKPV